MWNGILYFLAGFLRAKCIRGPQGEPYLERHLLCRVGQHAVFLHRFLASDSDHGLHDHPWRRSISFVLCGGYIEKRLVSKDGEIWMARRDVSAGSFNVIGGDDFHQVVLSPGRPAWTVFYHGPRVKGWGFAVSEEASSAGPCEYIVDGYDEVEQGAPEGEPWELRAPRARALRGRMPSDYAHGVAQGGGDASQP